MNQLLTQLVTTITLLIIALASAYFAKMKTKHTRLAQYIDLLENITVASVQAINGALVDGLKKDGEFTALKQKEAFEKAFSNIKNQLTEEARKALQLAYGDVDEYIKTLITAKVETVKLEKKVAEKPAVSVEISKETK